MSRVGAWAHSTPVLGEELDWLAPGSTSVRGWATATQRVDLVFRRPRTAESLPVAAVVVVLLSRPGQNPVTAEVGAAIALTNDDEVGRVMDVRLPAGPVLLSVRNATGLLLPPGCTLTMETPR